MLFLFVCCPCRELTGTEKQWNRQGMRHYAYLTIVITVAALLYAGCCNDERVSATVKYELNVSGDLLQIAELEVSIVENGVEQTFKPARQDFVKDTHVHVSSRIVVNHNGVSDTVQDSCYYYVYTKDFAYTNVSRVSHLYVVKYLPVGPVPSGESGYYDQYTKVTCSTEHGSYTASPSIAVNRANAAEYLAGLQANPDTIKVEVSADGIISVVSNRN